MDRETRELIHNYAKNMYRSCSVDELWVLESITEEGWKFNYDEDRDHGLDRDLFVSIVKTCRFLREGNIETYSLFDERRFFDAFSLFQNNEVKQ